MIIKKHISEEISNLNTVIDVALYIDSRSKILISELGDLKDRCRELNICVLFAHLDGAYAIGLKGLHIKEFNFDYSKDYMFKINGNKFTAHFPSQHLTGDTVHDRYTIEFKTDVKHETFNQMCHVNKGLVFAKGIVFNY